jgi:Flp pilus assembly protein TadB
VIALLFLEIVALLGVMAVFAVSDLTRVRQRFRNRRAGVRLLESEKDLAASLGIDPRRWIVLRVVTVAASVVVGVLSGVLVIAVVLLLVAVAGVPWLLEDVAASRRLRADRALVATLRTIARGLSRTGSLDVALREVAQHPVADLRRLLAPLRVAETIPSALLSMAALSRSTFVEDVTVLLLVGRARNPAELVRQLEEQVIPAMEDEIELLREHRAAAATQRRSAQVIGGVLAFLVGVFNVVPSMHEFFASTQGQLTLVAAAFLCAASIVAQRALLRPEHPVRWDLAAAPVVVERLSRE